MWLRLWALIIKEFLAVLKDPRSRISILLPPLVQLILFTPAATLDVKNVPIGILNRDVGEQGFELTQRFHGSPFFSRIIYLNSNEELKPFMDQQKGVMVLSIDESFSRKLNEKKGAEVQLILDGRKSNTAQILLGYASEVIERFNQSFLSEQEPFEKRSKLVLRIWFNPNLTYPWYNIPCLVAVLSMLACLIVTTQSVSRERELGTFDQLLVSPLIPIEILVGKIVPGIVIGMAEGCFLMALGILLYQVPFTGSFLLFLLSQFIFVLAISGVGLFISSLCFTQQQAMLGAFIFMMPSVLLSGFATPIENMPTWLQPITFVIPLKYMLVLCKGVFLKALSWKSAFSQVWPLAVIAFFNLWGAGIFFKKRMQ